MTEDDRLDQLLALDAIDGPSPDLMRRVAELPLRHPRTTWQQLDLLLPLRRLLAGGMIALLLGACAGYATTEETITTDAETLSLGEEFSPELSLVEDDDGEALP